MVKEGDACNLSSNSSDKNNMTENDKANVAKCEMGESCQGVIWELFALLMQLSVNLEIRPEKIKT